MKRARLRSTHTRSLLVAVLLVVGACNAIAEIREPILDETVTCDNDSRDEFETDYDCGGPCLPCADGQRCDIDDDCISLVCRDGLCQPPSCGDGVLHPALGEACDDGDSIDGRCDAACTVREVLSVVSGWSHVCVILYDGLVKCWGNNSQGQLGLEDTNNRGDEPGEMGGNLPAVSLGAGRKAFALAAGRDHTCVLLDDASVKCWGGNTSGQLGLGDTEVRGDELNEMGDALHAVDLGTGVAVVELAGGHYHTCALLHDGSVKCWGNNAQGQLGLGDSDGRGDETGEMGDALAAVNLGDGKKAQAITAGAWHTCALLMDGSLKCWGANGVGQLGLGDTNSRGDEPDDMGESLQAIDLGPNAVVTSIAAGSAHTCASLQDGRLTCWGLNQYGQLGLGVTENRGDGPGEMGDSLLAVDLGAPTAAVVGMNATNQTCVLFGDGAIKCWGFNGGGQHGQGDTTSRGAQPEDMGNNLHAVELGMNKTAVAIGREGANPCALLNDGAVKCWGYNADGQLGLGDTDSRGDDPGEMGDDLPAVKLFSDEW